MRRPHFDAVIFDFDGTVSDSAEGIFNSVLYAAEAFGYARLSDEQLRYFIGPPLQHSFMHILGADEARAQALVEKYRERYRSQGIYEARVYDGIPPLLSLLREAGIRLGIASSKPTPFIQKILAQHKLEHAFDQITGVGFSQSEPDKAALIRTTMQSLGLQSQSRALMVGDRKFDIEGAHLAGIPCAAVLYGFGSREEFEQAGADYIVPSPEALQSIVLED